MKVAPHRTATFWTAFRIALLFVFLCTSMGLILAQLIVGLVITLLKLMGWLG